MKQKVVEANELLEIWKDYKYNRINNIRENIPFYHKTIWEDILPFWHLKAKINELKKQIIAFAKELEDDRIAFTELQVDL